MVKTPSPAELHASLVERYGEIVSAVVDGGEEVLVHVDHAFEPPLVSITRLNTDKPLSIVLDGFSLHIKSGDGDLALAKTRDIEELALNTLKKMFGGRS